MRIGHGFDIHRFGGKNPLVLGGVSIPFVCGVFAHSDGDVMLHAIMDALLGAVSLGDIGLLFPNDDIFFRGIDSRKLLRIVWTHVLQKGYSLGNLDVTLMIQVPKIISYFPQMSFNLAYDLQCKVDDVNIKSTTTEGLGCIGRGEGLACEAVVLLKKNLDLLFFFGFFYMNVF